MTNATTRYKKITAELTIIRELGANLAERAKKLEEALAAEQPKARGTREVAVQAHVATAIVKQRVGDETTTEVLAEAVRAAITGRARTLHEIIEATGARRNRISGVLVKLQVANPGLVKNLGTSARALWYIEPARPSGRYTSRRDR